VFLRPTACPASPSGLLQVSFDLSVPARLQQPGFAAISAGFAKKLTSSAPFLGPVSSFAACSAPRSGCPPSTSPQRSPTSKLFSLSPSVLLRPASPTASIAVGSSSKTNLVSVQSPPLFEDFRPKPSILSPRRRCKRLARMTLRSFTPSFPQDVRICLPWFKIQFFRLVQSPFTP
jgi:hypothetical protein